MSPDPLLSEMVVSIRSGGHASELLRDHQADHTLHCRVCRQKSPCPIFAAALLAFEAPVTVKLPKEWKKP